MKTYVIEAIKRIKRFSEKFDVSSTLCDKTWIVFNDTGEREVYIFQPDGTMFITTDGVGIKGEWHWVSANKSLIINKDGNVVMLHPEFIDNVLLALTLDGTEEMVFLIDQENKESFIAKTLMQLEQYFISKEKELITQVNNKVEIERQNQVESLRQQKEFEKEEKLRREARELSFTLTHKMDALITIGSPVLMVSFIVLILYFGDGYYGLLFILLPVFCILILIIANKKNRDTIEKWKAEHPNDPRNNYLQ